MSLKTAIENIGNQIQDLSELEVVTYTGDVNVAINAQTGELNWSQLKANAAAAQGTLKVVAATQLKFDGDSYTFQTNEELPRMAELLALHQQAIINSLQTRKSIIDFFAENFKALAK